MLSVLFAQLLLAAAPAPAPSPGAWILTCDIGPAAGLNTSPVRVFRLAPRLLQEWRADDRKFGPNLCESFRCTATPGRLEGSIESATLIFTVALDPQARRASWRTVGASGHARTSGDCQAEADTLGLGGKGSVRPRPGAPPPGTMAKPPGSPPESEN